MGRHYPKLTGEERCSICGQSAEYWSWKEGERICKKCSYDADYRKNNLDPNSAVGFGFIAQRIVGRTLEIDIENDCNCSKSFSHPYDLYDSVKYGKIDVKAATLTSRGVWVFHFYQEYIPDTYVLLAFSKDRKDIEHVWVTPGDSILTSEKTGITIKNDINSGLKRAKEWETDNKVYNDIYHNMSISKCNVLRGE